MTLQVARIVATTAATPYGTLQVAGVTVAASEATPDVPKSTLQIAAITVAASRGIATLQIAKVNVAASTTTQPPTATTNAAQTVDAGQTVTLTGSDVDPSGTITQRTWRVITGTATLTGTTTQATTYKAPASLTNQTITFGYVAKSSTGLTSPEATVTHTIIAATERAIRGGVEVPAYIG